MEITERWLGEIAGWQVLKAARSVVERGLVSESRREGEDIKGLVTEGPKRYQSGLLVRTRTDVENLCTCPTSRGRGLICAHSIAVALTLIQKPVVQTQFPNRNSKFETRNSRPEQPAASIQQPASSLPPPGRFTFFPSREPPRRQLQGPSRRVHALRGGAEW